MAHRRSSVRFHTDFGFRLTSQLFHSSLGCIPPRTLKEQPLENWKVQVFYRSDALPVYRTTSIQFLHCVVAAAQCIVIIPICGFVAVFVSLWVCYYDNSKLRASILTKLGL